MSLHIPQKGGFLGFFCCVDAIGRGGNRLWKKPVKFGYNEKPPVEAAYVSSIKNSGNALQEKVFGILFNRIP